MKRIIYSFLILLLISCGNSDRELNISTSNISKIVEGIPQFSALMNTNKNKTLILLKNNDCISCELVTSKYIEDKIHLKNIIVIAEDVRPVESKSFYQNHPFLLSVPHILNDSISLLICDVINLKLESSIIINFNNNNILSKSEYLKNSFN